MSEFKTTVKVNTFSRTKLGRTTGVIFCSLEGYDFPVYNWDDFPIVILGWWIDSLNSLGEEGSSQELLFMDGPFALNLTVVERGWCEIEGVEGGVISSLGIYSIDEIKSSFNETAREIIDFCIEKNWDYEDVRSLAAKLS